MPNMQRGSGLLPFSLEPTKDIGLIRRELRCLFEAGLSWDEARGMVVPVGHNMTAAFRAEWMDRLAAKVSP